MNAKKILAIVASVISMILLILADWVAGGLGVLFGIFVIAVLWLRLLGFLGILSLPSLVKNLSSGVIVIGFISIITIGTVRQVRELESKPSTPAKTSAATVQTATDYPLCPDADREFYINSEKKSVAFQGLSSCWGPKVNVPAHTDFDIVMERIEGVQFWNGETWDRETVLHYLKKKDGWMGKLKYTAFRLRGVGEAKVSI